MTFAQRLTCTMVLLLAAFFSAGGTVMIYGSFTDDLTATARQEQALHNAACQTLENEWAVQSGIGTPDKSAALIAAFDALTDRHGDHDRVLLYQGEVLAHSAVQAETLSAWQAALPESGTSRIVQQDGRWVRLWRTDLIGGYTVVSACSLDAVMVGRGRDLRRFLLLEGAVLIGAVIVCAWASQRLTRPLATLTEASARIAAGDYTLRTNLHSQDELGQLSASFDRMAAAVEEQIAALQLSVQQREDFMAAFTHELKTPMTTILGYSDTLRTMQVDPDEQRQATNAIFHEAKRLEALGGKLLQLLHLSQEPLALSPVPLAPILRTAVRSAGSVLHGCPVTLPQTDAVVLGDADLLADLLLNLLTNAARAVDDGSPIAITLQHTDDGALDLSVTDHGCGIPPDQLSRITEPFYMVDKSRARKQGGSGLGLALAQTIAAAHGTTLHFTSTVGQGTTVRFVLQEVTP